MVEKFKFDILWNSNRQWKTKEKTEKPLSLPFKKEKTITSIRKKYHSIEFKSTRSKSKDFTNFPFRID